MRAFILAAGLGTRLRPLTERIPKPLVEIGGEPLIVRAVRQLRAAGVSQIGVNLFHLGEQIPALLGDGGALGVELTYFDERPEVLGTGGGLKHAEAFLGSGGQPFLLVNSDVWHDFDLRALVLAHRAEALATLAVHRMGRRPELHNVGCVPDLAGSERSLHRGSVVHIADAPAGTDATFRAIYTGVAVYAPRLLDFLPAGKVSGLVTHGLVPAMAAGEQVRFFAPHGSWFDCGTHAEVLRASSHALRSRGLGMRVVGRATVPYGALQP